MTYFTDEVEDPHAGPAYIFNLDLRVQFDMGKLVCYHFLCLQNIWSSFNPCHAEWIKMLCPLLTDNQSDYLIQFFLYKFKYQMANNAGPDQLASSASWCESILFAKTGYIWAQQDQDY